MGGRVALVIGSECAALPTLGFPSELATELWLGLTGAGGWRSATEYEGPILNPTAAELAAAVTNAFENAANQQATLLLSFVGHGTATSSDDFYLLANDSPYVPDSGTAFHLTQGIRERLNRFATDGLIVLVDACETEQGVSGAARRWIDLLAQSFGRMELLVAASNGPAYAGCFTRTIVATFSHGLAMSGEHLLPADLAGPIAAHCTRQRPQHLSFSAGIPAALGDPGLWLVFNAARRDDAVSGRPCAGIVDQLTRGLLLTPALRDRLTDVVETGTHRLRAVVGPAGCGKSTLMATLIRPNLADNLGEVTARYVTAAVFLDVTSTIESFASELSEQLRHRLPDYSEVQAIVQRELTEQERAELDQFEVRVLRPLAQLAKPGRRITLVVDGLDQPEAGSRSLLAAAVHELTCRAELTHIRVIAGIRAGTGVEDAHELRHMHRINLSAPTAHDIAAATTAGLTDAAVVGWIESLLEQLPEGTPAGGWLLARLLGEIDSKTTGSDPLTGFGLDTLVKLRVGIAVSGAKPNATVAILSLLAAAGEGPVLPVRLLLSALAFQGIERNYTQIRDIVVGLGALISRGDPGSPQESLGIAHSVLIEPVSAALQSLGADTSQAHLAITAAIESRTSELTDVYARGSAVRHYLAQGRSAEAVSYLKELETLRAADNRDQWASWLPSFMETVGRDHPDTLIARYRHARAVAESGQVAVAVWALEQLRTDQQRALGTDHPDTITTHSSLAYWLGELGEITRAITEHERVLSARTQVLGPEHPDTLGTRNHLALLYGKNGDIIRAITEHKNVLAIQKRVLGTDHPYTLYTRNDLADSRGRNGDITTAITELEQLIVDQHSVLGPNHLDTLHARANLANWRWQSGDSTTAIAELEQLLEDQLRTLGPDHLDTLRTRDNLDVWLNRSP